MTVKVTKTQANISRGQDQRIVVNDIAHRQGATTTRPKPVVHQGSNTIERIVNGNT